MQPNVKFVIDFQQHILATWAFENYGVWMTEILVFGILRKIFPSILRHSVVKMLICRIQTPKE
jgi:hypothetical protein